MKPSFLLPCRISFPAAVIVLVFADTRDYESDLKFLVPKLPAVERIDRDGIKVIRHEIGEGGGKPAVG